MMRTNELSATTDAQMWAKEWCRIANEIEAADDGRQVIDEGWMIGWFANAIEVGRDAGRKASTADVLEMARSLEGASEEWVCFLDGGYEDRCRRPEDIDRKDPLDTQWHGNCGRYLVIPLPEGEER